MFITIAVIFVLLASFLLIIVNMYSDYVARREQDARLISTRARNIITECEELLLNQAQVAFSKTLVLVLHYRIIRKKLFILHKSQSEYIIRKIDEAELKSWNRSKDPIETARNKRKNNTVVFS